MNFKKTLRMQAERSYHLLRKYCSYTFFNLLFIAAIANMFSKNLFDTLNKPLYYIHRVKNIEYIFFLASFTMVLYLQYEKYVQNISKKKLFILTFLSRMIFYSTFKIVLYFGFGLSVNYYRNFVLFIILNLWFALFDLFYYFSGKVNIKTYKPEGVIILFFKKSWTFFKESHKTMILPFILSFITYKSLRTICFNYIFKKENSFFKEIFHYFISFLVCYISSFFFNFLHNLTIFSYDYNISNVDNCIFNDVKFEELEVHPLFFNKLMSCFEEMNTKIKIVKTKAVVNYLKKCMFLEVEKIKEILKKLEELYWNVESTKYFLFTECRVVKKNQPDPVFKRLPTHNYIEIFKEEFKAFFIKRFYKFALNNSFEYLKEMYSFMEDADKQDGLFKLIDDVNYAVKKDLNNLKEKGVDLERKLGLFLWKDVLSQ